MLASVLISVVCFHLVVLTQLLLLRRSPWFCPDVIPVQSGLHLPQNRPARAPPRPRLQPRAVPLRQGPVHPSGVGEHRVWWESGSRNPTPSNLTNLISSPKAQPELVRSRLIYSRRQNLNDMQASWKIDNPREFVTDDWNLTQVEKLTKLYLLSRQQSSCIANIPMDMFECLNDPRNHAVRGKNLAREDWF